MSGEFILNLQLASTAFMCGVIWVVQLLLYPNFLNVDPDRFCDHHKHHTNKITWVVAPSMTIELLCALVLLFINRNYFFTLNLLSVMVLWVQTGLISVPLHNRLSSGWDFLSASKLVKMNWIRTIIWSLRLLLLITYNYL